MYLKDTLVISICKINASEMLHLRTASFQYLQPCFLSSLNRNLDDPIKSMRQTDGSNLISPGHWNTFFSIKKGSIVGLITLVKS